jgi:hypothetical protein
MREEKLRLADTYLSLGDVSCETGEFYTPLHGFRLIVVTISSSTSTCEVANSR